MKLTMRPCVWESNSSMTNSYAHLSEYQFKKWKSGGYYLFLGAEGELVNSKGKEVKEGGLYTEEETLDFARHYDGFLITPWDDRTEEAIKEEKIKRQIFMKYGFFDYESVVGNHADNITIKEPVKKYTIEREWFCG